MLTSTLELKPTDTLTLNAWELATSYAHQALPVMIDAVPNSAALLTDLEDLTRQVLKQWSIELVDDQDLDRLAENITVSTVDLYENARERGLRGANPRDLATELERHFLTITGPEDRIAALTPRRAAVSF